MKEHNSEQNLETKRFIKKCYIAIGIFSITLIICICIVAYSAGIIKIGKSNDSADIVQTYNEQPLQEDSKLNEPLIGESEDNMQTEQDVSESVTERDNSTAEETVLITGTWLVGTDIPEGRYIITGDGNGNLFIYDNDIAIINEILTSGENPIDTASNELEQLAAEAGIDMSEYSIDLNLDEISNIGVESVTVDLNEGQKIEISGINNVTFSPAETELSNKLTTGMWTVGLDIKAGSYIATCKKDTSGNFVVYDGDLPVVNEILGDTGLGIGVDNVKVDLTDGQVIHIGGLPFVNFR